MLPVYLLLLLSLIVGGLGVFHYQQTACLAQEAARWASVRGSDYQKDTNQPSPTTQQILQQVTPLAVGMDGMRQILYADEARGLIGLGWEIGLLVVMAGAFIDLARRSLAWLERRAREEGRLTVKWQ